MTEAPALVHSIHGLRLSYFTGKLEAYFRCKGVPYTLVEMDTADFRRCARETGVAQMPQVQRPNGDWLTDTSAIIAVFEAEQSKPALHPATPGARFFSLLLEDFFDEWLWRPALYYRWAFADDARLMSAQLARTMLRDLPLPFWVRRRFILARQRWVYLAQDGVTSANRAAIEALYAEIIAALDPIFAKRPFLFGETPCEADFGLFGPFFRHFSSDPTPAAILRETGPNILAWTARLWAGAPAEFSAGTRPDRAPDDLYPILDMVGIDYLPYLAANAIAVSEKLGRVQFRAGGALFDTPASPYRAQCLASLQRAFQALSVADQRAAAARLGANASILAQAPRLIAAPASRLRPVDRQWVGVAM